MLATAPNTDTIEQYTNGNNPEQQAHDGRATGADDADAREGEGTEEWQGLPTDPENLQPADRLVHRQLDSSYDWQGRHPKQSVADTGQLHFRDMQHAESFLQQRTPLKRPITDKDGVVITDDVEQVVREQSEYVKLFIKALKTQPSDEPRSAGQKLRSDTILAQWKGWQRAEHARHSQHVRDDDQDWLRAVEKRMWDVLKEIIAVHRVGYVEGLPAEEGMSCVGRIAWVNHIIIDFLSVRADMIDLNKDSVNIPFLVAAPSAYAQSRYQRFRAYCEAAEIHRSNPAEAAVPRTAEDIEGEREKLSDSDLEESTPPTLSKQPRKIIDQEERRLVQKSGQLATQKHAITTTRSAGNDDLKKTSDVLSGPDLPGNGPDASGRRARRFPANDKDGVPQDDGCGSDQDTIIVSQAANRGTAAPISNDRKGGPSRKEKKRGRQEDRKAHKLAQVNKELNKQQSRPGGPQQMQIVSKQSQGGIAASQDDPPRGRPRFTAAESSQTAGSQAGVTSKKSGRAPTPGPTRSQGRARSLSVAREENRARELEQAEQAERRRGEKIREQRKSRSKRHEKRAKSHGL